MGKVLIHGLIFKRMLRLKMFRDEQVSVEAAEVRQRDGVKGSLGDAGNVNDLDAVKIR